LLSASAPLNAQKFGYVNTMELLSLLPESRTADSTLKAYQAEIQEQYNSYLQEYAVKSQDYFRVKDSISEFVAQSKLADLESLEKRIKDYESNSNMLLQQRREELFQPVLARAQALIKEVAEENNYRMIFDTANGPIAYAPESDNIIGLLRKKLGLD
jgi:outer membrane protein